VLPQLEGYLFRRITACLLSPRKGELLLAGDNKILRRGKIIFLAAREGKIILIETRVSLLAKA